MSICPNCSHVQACEACGHIEIPDKCEVRGCLSPAEYEGWYRVTDPLLGTPTGLIQRRRVCAAHVPVLIGGQNEKPA